MSILGFNRYSQCENVYITIFNHYCGLLITAFNTKDKILARLTSRGGVKFSFLSGATNSYLVASYRNKLLSVDLAAKSNRTLDELRFVQ